MTTPREAVSGQEGGAKDVALLRLLGSAATLPEVVRGAGVVELLCGRLERLVAARLLVPPPRHPACGGAAAVTASGAAGDVCLRGLHGDGVYVGVAGLAWALLRAADGLEAAAQYCGGRWERGGGAAAVARAQQWRDAAAGAMRVVLRVDGGGGASRSMLRAGRFTLHEGASGVALLIAATAVAEGGAASRRRALDAAQEFCAVAAAAQRQLKAEESEVLYGRAGVVLAGLFFRHLLRSLQSTAPSPAPPPPSPEAEEAERVDALAADLDALLVELCDAIFADGAARGCALGEHGQPLLWAWHGKLYLGAVHGTAGIVLALLQVPQPVFARLPTAAAKEQLLIAAMRACYEKARYSSSGNYMSSVGSRSDSLVHICHGAPGFVLMFCAGARRFPRYAAEFTQCAVEAAEVVWERGLLDYSCGLCHGFAGNAFCFLALHRLLHFLHSHNTERAESGGEGGTHTHATAEGRSFLPSPPTLWLRRALHFGLRGEALLPHTVADRPASLFEGAAGYATLLAALVAECSILVSHDESAAASAATKALKAGNAWGDATSLFPGLEIADAAL